MALSRYFSRLVKPIITAQEQEDNGALDANDVLFDWTAFKIPKGGNKLIGVTALVRGLEGVNAQIGMELFFASSTRGNGGVTAGAAPTSIGVNDGAMGTVTANPFFNDLLGSTQILADDYTHNATTSVAHAALYNPHSIIMGESDAGKNSEGDVTCYVAATATGTPTLHSNVAVGEAGFGAGTQTVITVSGTDANLVFAPGDVIHANDNAVLGTISTVDSATQITLTAANTDAIVGSDGTADRLYNISPIHLILSFER